MLIKKYRANKSFFKNIKKTDNFSIKHTYLRLAPVELDHSVFAFIISSKQVKRAVDRNRIKRRARDIVAKMIDKIKPGFCVLIYFKPQNADFKYSEMEQELTNLFKKAKILE